MINTTCAAVFSWVHQKLLSENILRKTFLMLIEAVYLIKNSNNCKISLTYFTKKLLFYLKMLKYNLFTRCKAECSAAITPVFSVIGFIPQNSLMNRRFMSFSLNILFHRSESFPEDDVGADALSFYIITSERKSQVS